MSHDLSRRSFLQAAVVAGGAALTGSVRAAESSPSELPKRTLGKTGVTITAMTLGTAPCGFWKPHSPQLVADCVNAALDLGVTAVDTAPAYDVGEEGVGLGLGSRRKSVFLSTKVLADNVAAAEKILANSLKVLKTDYIDLAYFHQVGERDQEAALKADGVFTWLAKQKQAGKIRFVGISGHNRPGRFAKYLESGQCDVLLTVVNLADRYTYKFEENVLPIAQKNGVGVVAMKVFGGAKNMQYATAKGPNMPLEHLDLAVRYALGVQGVATLNLGCRTVDEVRQDVAMVAAYKPFTAEEAAKADAVGQSLAPQWGTHYGPLVRASSASRPYC